MGKKLFCEISPTTYKMSLMKEIFKRHVRNLMGKEKYASTRQEDKLPVLIASYRKDMIKRGPGINALHQQNKADNIRLACSRMDGVVVMPGETFSFWHYVGKTSKKNGFTEGRVIVNGKLVTGVGGGLCNLANTLHLLVMHSPLTVTELHHHSDALAPDPNGEYVPYAAGTSVNYNFIDFRFRNDTTQPFQLLVRTEGDDLVAELRAMEPLPHTYRLVAEDHHFQRSASGHYYRLARIYRETLDAHSGEVLSRTLLWDNRSRVYFDPSLIPPHLLR